MPPTVVIAKGDEKGKEYPGDLTWYVIWACVIAGMAVSSSDMISLHTSFFRYDIGISGWVTAMPEFLEHFFEDVYKKQKGDTSTNQYCKFDSFKLTLFTSSLYLAALFASLVASVLTRKLDRKVMMVSGGFVFFAGALINALAQNIWMLIVGRILLGIGVGFVNQKRVPSSEKVRGVDDVDTELDDMIAASEASRSVKRPWRNLFQRNYRPQAVMAFLIPTMQQLTGINVIMFYAPVLFKTIGFGNDASLMSAVITGIVNMLSTFVSIYGVDKWGRRALFLEGSTQMLICQIIITACIGAKFGVSGEVTDLPMWFAVIVVIVICIYVAAYAWSWGPLAWLVPSEIFPLEIRSAAQSVTVSMNMFFTFVVAQLFLTMLCHMKFGLFMFFAFFDFANSLFVYFFLPETKGIPIEEMTQVWKDHWFWGRFVSDDETAVKTEMGINGNHNGNP
ncbi:hypothetical protein Droror1_Dr00010472 [Drosera rotundifolia]